MLRKKLLIITFALAGVLVSLPVLANTCPSASPQGVGCTAGTYYCSGSCRSGLSWCPTWSPTPTCASGLSCANCSGADTCGVCNSCNSGYRLCGAYPNSFCKDNNTLPSNCASYNTNCDACASCVAGYTLEGSTCVAATLKLGSSSVSGTNVAQGGVDSSLFVSGNKVGIGISAPNANLQLNSTTNTEGLRIITSNYSPFIIRNITDTADLFRIDQDGNITSLGNMSGSNTYWNLNGSSLFASSTAWNVGIGTTNATDKLTVVGGINSNSIINGLSLCINGDCKTSWGDAGWAFDGNTVGQTKSFGTLDNYSIPFLTNSIERMRLTDTGNLVIGTSTTGVRLHVESPQGAVAFFKSKLNGGSYAGYIGNGQTFSGEEFGLYYADGVFDNRLAVYNLNSSLFLYGGHLSSDASLAISNVSGNVGVGTTNPRASLDVVGKSNTSVIAQFSNSDVPEGFAFGYDLYGGEQGLYEMTNGTLLVGQLVSDPNILKIGLDSIYVSNYNYNIGLGTTNPTSKLTISNGDIKIDNNRSIRLDSGATTTLLLGNYSDGAAFTYGSSPSPVRWVANLAVEGDSKANRLCIRDDCKAAWSEISSLPAGTTSYTLRYDGSNWVNNGNIFNNGTNVGIGTTTPGAYRLSVDGTTRLNGAVTTSLSGSGNRCVYVDATGNLLAKGVDCGTATGGDNLGDHSATQNIRLNSYWLSGDAGNEGIFVDSAGGVGVGTNSITAGLRLLVSGNLSSSGTVSFTGPVYVGGGNRVITVDNAGVLGATAMTSLPAGTAGHTLRYNGSSWVSNALLYNNGTNIGIGTTNPGAPFSVVSSSDVDTFTLTNQALSANIGFVLRLPLSTGPNDGKAFGFYAGGESWTRGIFYSDGAYGIGPGNATRDVFLRRYSTNNLMIDSNKAGGAANLLVTGNLGLGTTNPGTHRLNVVGTSNLGGNVTATGTVSFTGVVFTGGGNRMITVDNAGVLGASAIPSLPSGTSGHTLRYDGSNWVSNSVIYNNGTNVGIGVTPSYKLDVNGSFRASGVATIETSSDQILNLRQMGMGGTAGVRDPGWNYIGFMDSENDRQAYFGVDSSGNMLFNPEISGATVRTNSSFVVASGNLNISNGTFTQSGAVNSSFAGNLGVGITNPGTYRLNVNGTSNLGGNLTTTGTVSFTGVVFAGGGNRMITVDNAGVLGAATMPTSLPAGTTSYTLRYDGSNWVNNGNIFNNGTNVGIGTTTPGAYRLSVDGTTRLNGAVTTSLSGSGNRCVYVDATGNLLAKGVDCGTATGGDNLGDHSATQNIRLNSYWLSGDGGNEGIFVHSGGKVGVGVGMTNPTYGLDVNGIIRSNTRIMMESPGGTAAMFSADEYGAGESGLYSGGGYRIATYSDFDSVYQYADGSIYSYSGNVGIGTTAPGAYRLNVNGTSNLGGNLTTTGTVSFTGVVFAGGGNRMITVDNAGVLGAAAMPTSLPAGTSGYTLRYNGSSWVSNSVIYNNGTSVGIGTSSPTALVHIKGISGDLFRITNSGGNEAFSIDNGGLKAKFYGGGGINYPSITFTSNINAGLGGASGGVSLISSSLARLVVDSTGNIGIGTTNPGTYRLNVVGTSNLGGNLTATGTVSFTGVVFAGGGNRIITVDNAGVLGASALPASLPAGTSGYTLRYDGSNWVSNNVIYNNGTNVGVGTSSPGAKLHVLGNAIISSSLTMGGDVNMGGNNITNLNKLTVNTIDPLYNIQGVNYSTFASSIVGGVKEEYVGTIKVAQAVAGGGEEYEAVVNFDAVAKGSDLWVWRQVVDFSEENVQVNITPYGGFASTYYQIQGNKLIFRSDRPAELSYRLVGKRLDWRQWPTKAVDQQEKAGFKID